MPRSSLGRAVLFACAAGVALGCGQAPGQGTPLGAARPVVSSAALSSAERLSSDAGGAGLGSAAAAGSGSPPFRPDAGVDAGVGAVAEEPSGAEPGRVLQVELAEFAEPLPVELAGDSIRVLAYPESFAARARLLNRPLGVKPGGIDDAFCAGVERNVERVERGGSFATFARARLRQQAVYDVLVPFNPAAVGALEPALGRLALESGSESGARLANPWLVDDIQISLIVAPDAWVQRLGDVGALEQQLRSDLRSQPQTARSAGLFLTSLPASDWVCDLATGRVAIVVTFQGHAGSVPLAGRTEVRGMEH